MNKKILAVSVAAALSAGASVATAASTLATGTSLVIPYYTVQNGNSTLINIVNTDTVGKALKVRFRGAQRSDDVFDFQLFMSPGDMWTANVSQGADGVAQLSTEDNSCTLPANVNQAFVTSRLAGTDAEKAAGTREGYVEIINMGNIIPASDALLEFGVSGEDTTTNTIAARGALFTATKHVNGEAPCDATILESVVDRSSRNAVSVTGAQAGAKATGRLSGSASGGLFANVTIINVNEASAWGFDATPVRTGSIPTRYWSQTADAYTGLLPDLFRVTLDGIFLSRAVTPAQYDFPDLSTPRGTVDPFAEYQLINNSISSTSLSNEFITADSIFAATDWVVAMPTRRYAVEGRGVVWPESVVNAVNNVLTGEGIAGPGAAFVYAAPGPVNFDTTAPISGNVINNYLAPFTTLYNASTNCVRVSSFSVYDREETTTSTGVVISPGEVSQLALCGEVGVISFNNGGASTTSALGAELTINDATFPFVDGWAVANFGSAGLPVIGNAFIKANNGGSGLNNMNFGAAYKHR